MLTEDDLKKRCLLEDGKKKGERKTKSAVFTLAQFIENWFSKWTVCQMTMNQMYWFMQNVFLMTIYSSGHFVLNVMLLIAFWRLLLNFSGMVFILLSEQRSKESTVDFAPSTSNSQEHGGRPPACKKHSWAAHPREGVTNGQRMKRLRGRWRKEGQRTWRAWGLRGRVREELTWEAGRTQEWGLGWAEAKGPRVQPSSGSWEPSLLVPRVGVNLVRNQVLEMGKIADYKTCIPKTLGGKLGYYQILLPTQIYINTHREHTPQKCRG